MITTLAYRSTTAMGASGTSSKMKSTKKLINEPADTVTEFLEGYVSSVKHVQLLEGSPDVRKPAMHCLPCPSVSCL